MDPLSAPASAIALITTAFSISGSIYKTIRAITNAPDDLYILSNEVQDLRVVLASIELSIKANSDIPEPFDRFSVIPTILRRTEEKLLQLDTLLREFCDIGQQSRLTFKNLDWSLRGKEKAKKIKEDLHSLKWSLSTSIGTQSA